MSLLRSKQAYGMLVTSSILWSLLSQCSSQSYARSNYATDHDNSEVTSIGCYQCSSVNGSDPDCEDEFVAKEEYYVANCMAAKKSYNRDGGKSTRARVGLYPATWCIKFKAVDDSTGENRTVRDCAADSGGTTYDTEIGGMSHCGLMRNLKYEGKEMKGCIMTCKQNGCNKGSRLLLPISVLLALAVAQLIS